MAIQINIFRLKHNEKNMTMTC